MELPDFLQTDWKRRDHGLDEAYCYMVGVGPVTVLCGSRDEPSENDERLIRFLERVPALVRLAGEMVREDGEWMWEDYFELSGLIKEIRGEKLEE